MQCRTAQESKSGEELEDQKFDSGPCIKGLCNRDGKRVGNNMLEARMSSQNGCGGLCKLILEKSDTLKV